MFQNKIFYFSELLQNYITSCKVLCYFCILINYKILGESLNCWWCRNNVQILLIISKIFSGINREEKFLIVNMNCVIYFEMPLKKFKFTENLKENLNLLKICTEQSNWQIWKITNMFIDRSKIDNNVAVFQRYPRKIHCSPKVTVQPALNFSSFGHNSSINELKNMKLCEHIYYEMIKWILYCCGFGNSL